MFCSACSRMACGISNGFSVITSSQTYGIKAAAAFLYKAQALAL
jgi:hypothetical protein